MFVDYYTAGKFVKAIQVGQWMVFVCCTQSRPDGTVVDLHGVTYERTGEMVMCHLSQRGALLLADTLSIYEPERTRGTPRVSKAMTAWIMLAEEQLKQGVDPVPYAHHQETKTGRRPSLPVYMPKPGDADWQSKL